MKLTSSRFSVLLGAGFCFGDDGALNIETPVGEITAMSVSSSHSMRRLMWSFWMMSLL